MDRDFRSGARLLACLLAVSIAASAQSDNSLRIASPTLFGGTVSVKRLKRDPKGRGVEEFRLAHEYLRRGDRRNGRKHLERALKHDPDYIEARVAYGVHLAREDQWGTASVEFEKATQTDPHHLPAVYNYGLSLLRLGQAKAAENAATWALDISPEDPLVNFLYSLAITSQGRSTEKSLSCLRKAAKSVALARQTLERLELRAQHSSN